MYKFFIHPFQNFFLDRSIPLDVALFSTLLILTPFALISGPAIPDILLSIIALYFLIKSILFNYWQYYKNSIFIGFILFSSYGIARSLFTEIPILSLTNEGSVFYFRYIFFALGVSYLLNNNPYIQKCLTSILAFTLIILISNAFIQYIFDENLFGHSKFRPYRLSDLLGNEPTIGKLISYLSALLLSLLCLNFHNTKKLMIFLVLLQIVCGAAVFLSGDRSSFFYLSMFFILFIIFVPHFRKYGAMAFVGFVLMIFSIIQINSVAKERMIDISIKQINQTKFPFLPYSEGHEQHYITSLRMFKENPIFGIGTNTYRYLCGDKKYIYKKSCATHPHNYYFQILAELGILGFLFISSFYLYLIFIAVRKLVYSTHLKNNNILNNNEILYVLIMLTFFWPIIPNLSFYNNWNNVFMALVLGFLMKALYKNN